MTGPPHHTKVREASTKDGARHAWGDMLVGAALAGTALMGWFAWRRETVLAADSRQPPPGLRPIVWTWGWGQYGQLGHGATSNKLVPTWLEMLASEDVVSLATGATVTAAITKDGALFTWGQGDSYRLGHGDEANQTLPMQVEALADRKIVQVACGDFHMLAVDEKGEVFSWGRGQWGRLGHDESKDERMPRPVKALAKKKITSVAAGRHHSLCLTEDGEVYTFGYNYEGQCAAGEERCCVTPRLVNGLQGHRVVKVACGREVSFAVTEDGKVWGWGSDEFGQLGMGRATRYQKEPKLIRSLSARGIKTLACGEYHAVAVTREGEVVSWGVGKEGQLGHGDVADVNIPKVMDALSGLEIVDIAAGGAHTAVVTAKGTVLLMGRGRDGQLGRGTIGYENLPKPVTALVERMAKQVSLGGDHTAVLTIGQRGNAN